MRLKADPNLEDYTDNRALKSLYAHLALLILTVTIGYLPSAISISRQSERAVPLNLNLTLNPSSLTVEKVSVQDGRLEVSFRNTSREPLKIGVLALKVTSPFNTSCVVSAPPLLSLTVLTCNYNSSLDKAFKPYLLRPSENLTTIIFITPSITLSQPNWSGTAQVELNVGNFTFIKKLNYMVKISGKLEAHQDVLRLKINLEGNSSVKVSFHSMLQARAANILGILEARAFNCITNLSLGRDALEIDGSAMPPATLNITLSLAPPNSVAGGYLASATLQMGNVKISNATIPLSSAKTVNIKQATIPYVFNLEVPDTETGYVLVAVGQHIYNVTLSEGKGSFAASEAFWPVLTGVEVKPLKVATTENGVVNTSPAVSSTGGIHIITGGMTLVLLSFLILLILYHFFSLRKIKEKCKPFTEIVIEP